MKKNYADELLEKIEGRKWPSDEFHVLTNNKKLNPSKQNYPQSWIKIHFKTYPRLDKVSFENIKSPTTTLSKIIAKRRSIRKFSGFTILKDELFYLLFSSCGLTRLGKTLDDSRRPYPSAGTRYLEVYSIILNCEGFKKGLYHYNVKENLMELLFEEDLGNWLIKNTGEEKWITNAAVIFIITGILDRTRIKYGDRGYRLALIEAGHLSQNLLLLATELGLGSCPLAGFIDTDMNKLLDINLQKEVALYTIVVGKL